MDRSSTILGKIGRRSSIQQLRRELHEAVARGDHDLTNKLIAHGAPLEASNRLGSTPLHVAVSKGNVGMVQLLVAQGADRDAMDSGGYTPLALAAEKGHHAVAKAVLAAGADASIRRHGVFSALDVAATKGHVLVISVLVRHGIDVNDAKQQSGETALHHAARENQADAIDVLVAAGANTEAKNEHEVTPLHEASGALGVEAAVSLLKHGADVNARDTFGHTPLHEAAHHAGKRGAVEMVDLLLRRGGDETATTRFGRKIPADVVGVFCSATTKEAGGVERVRKLLENAPGAREAWQRRGLLVASRARPHMIVLRTRKRARGERMMVLLSTRKRAREEWVELMGRVLRLAEERTFRTIVAYL